MWEARSGKALASLNGHKGYVSYLGFTPDGSRIASGSVDRELKLWELKQYREILSLSGQADTITSLGFSRDGQRLLCSGADGVLLLRESTPIPEHGQDQPLTLIGHTNRIWSIAFTRQGQLVSAREDWNGLVWDLSRQQHAGRFDSLFYTSVSSDGRYLVSCGPNPRSSDFYATILDAPSRSHSAWPRWPEPTSMNDAITGRKLETFFGHTGVVSALAFSPDSRTLASGSGDQTIRLWRVEAE